MRLPLPRSLVGQFVALHVVTVLIAVLTLAWSVPVLLHQTARTFQRGLLHRQAATSLTFLHAAPAVRPPIVLSSGMAVGFIGRDRRVQRFYGPPRPDILAVAPLGRTPRFFRVKTIEGLSLPHDSSWLVVSRDDADPAIVSDDIVRSFLFRFALVSLPIAVLVPLVGALLAQRLTVRMRAVSRAAEQIGPRSLDRRLPLGLLPLEAEPFAKATNAALDRLAAAIAVQTAFAADVAHELRTPLAVVRLRADAVTDPAIRTAVMSAVDRAARVIDQLLALAELERPLEGGGTLVDLHALAHEVVADRAPAVLASGRTIALENHPAPARMHGYSEALRMALENLVDNAIRHTPVGTTITVSSGPGHRIAVGDDGPPIAEADLSRLKERLWRGAGATVKSAGIGLSIVERVAQAHGGGLTIRRGAGGVGLTFEIRTNIT